MKIHAVPAALASIMPIIAVLAAPAVFAPAIAAPAPEMCMQSDFGDRLNCKFKNIATQQESAAAMIDMMSDIPPGRKKALMDATERTMKSQGRSDAADFKSLAKKKNPKCQIVEIVGDGKGDDDGVCRGNEDCVEENNDSIGNNDGICKPRNGKNREICAEICDDEAIASNDENFDETERGKDLEDELDGATAQYVELNQMLETGMANQVAFQALADVDDPCITAIKVRDSSLLINAALGVKLSLSGIAEVADKFCNQDTAGFNAAAACVVIDLAKTAGEITFEVLDFRDGNIDSDTVDATFECVQDINAAVDQGNDELEEIKQKVNDLDQKLNDVQAQLMDIMDTLRTPFGRREGFNDN